MRRLLYCDHHEFPLPPGHKFPLRKYRLLRETLESDGFYRLKPASPASAGDIRLAHDDAYVNRFLDGTLEASVMRRIGFPWSEALVHRTLTSVGGTLSATADAVATGFGGNLAGGTHHAFRAEGSGFCVFNDIAVAVAVLRRNRLARRVAIIDLDVHQGDGTARIFEDDAEVLTVSLHAGNNFPFRKQKSKIDIPLPDLTGDEEYLNSLHDILPRIADFRADLFFYQSGVDGLAEDRLGRLALTHEGLAERDRLVLEFARDSDVPVATTLGGGYAEPIEMTVEAHANTFRTAARVFGPRS